MKILQMFERPITYKLRPMPDNKEILANAALELLESPIFQNAFSEVYFNIHRGFDNLKTDDIKSLEQLKISLSVLNSIKNSIEKHIHNARLINE